MSILPVFFFMLVPLVDLLVGEKRIEGDRLEEDPAFDLFLYAQASFHLLVFLGTVHVAATADLPLWARLAAVLGFGLINGQCALIGHEFAHKTGQAKRVSARLGESIYAFALRDMPGEVVGGLSHKADRLHKKGLRPLSIHNRILQSYASSLAEPTVGYLSEGAAARMKTVQARRGFHVGTPAAQTDLNIPGADA